MRLAASAKSGLGFVHHELVGFLDSFCFTVSITRPFCLPLPPHTRAAQDRHSPGPLA